MIFRRFSSFVQRIRLIDRIKGDDRKCREALKSPQSKILPLDKGRHPLLEGKYLKWIDLNELPESTSTVFLGVNGGSTPLFAAKVNEQDFEKPSECEFVHQRVVLFKLKADEDLELASKAMSLLSWREKTKFCAFCGGRNLASSVSGHQISCPGCEKTFYPSPAPVGIALIENEPGDKVLLVRGQQFPEGLFSCVAGFVDCGESLESAVKREVAEEVGLEVESVSTIQQSQHWPFPNLGSVMLGCLAKVQEETVNLDTKELSEARWFTLEEMKEALKSNKERKSDFFIPPRAALAHRLIRLWVESKTKSKL